MYPNNIRRIYSTLTKIPLNELAPQYSTADRVTRTYYEVYIKTMTPKVLAEFRKHLDSTAQSAS
jgi:hypothetical protein